MSFLLRLLIGITFLHLCLFSLLGADEEIRDIHAKVSFPGTINLKEDSGDYLLVATGETTRSKSISRIYCIAHYLQGASKGNLDDVLESVFDDSKAKQITIVWLRDIVLRKIIDSYYETFHAILSESEQENLSSYITNFLQLYDRDARKTDKYDLQWLPGGRLRLLINGRLKGEIKNEEFARAVWSIWLGSKSVVERSQLLSLVLDTQKKN